MMGNILLFKAFSLPEILVFQSSTQSYGRRKKSLHAKVLFIVNYVNEVGKEQKAEFAHQFEFIIIIIPSN